MWLSWLGVVPQSERLLVQFPVRAHAWVAGLIPSQGILEATDWCFSLTLMFLSLPFTLPSPLSKDKYIKFFLKVTLEINILTSCESYPLPISFPKFEFVVSSQFCSLADILTFHG